MPNSNYTIALNFYPLGVQDLIFEAFRKLFLQEKKEGKFEALRTYKLPEDPNNPFNSDALWKDYWISFDPVKGFEKVECKIRLNPSLTVYFLYHLLLNKCKEALPPDSVFIDKRSFRRRIEFVISGHEEGEEIIWLEPYYLPEAKMLGFLMDFRFRKNPIIPKSSRKVLQLSLALNKDFKRNADFYVDKYYKLQTFIEEYYQKLFPLDIKSSLIAMKKSPYQVDASTLETKIYQVRNDIESKSQFMGIKDNGPLSVLDDKIIFHFVFLEKYREQARELFRALKGDLFPNRFSGMSEMFNVEFDNHNVNGQSLSEYNRISVEQLLSRFCQKEGFRQFPIILIPSRKDTDNRRIYVFLKYKLISSGIPFQVITEDIFSNKEILKWSIANIGLQIFAKLGGHPWRVKPSTEKCLIIGIGQSHDIKKIDNSYRVLKYFAYSVLTDSSGLYKDLQVIGSNREKEGYLRELRENLYKIISKYKGDYNKIVIHTPFKIRLEELKSIKKAVQEFGEDGPELVVVKINTVNKFFGYNLAVNSMVPFESTYLQISRNEYLVWFEGMQYHNPKIYRDCAGPTHIEFYYQSRALSDKDKKSYLQDAINLSGANWRGFNAKSLPVSTYYCTLVSRFVKDFNSMGYTEFNIDNLKPWFL